MTTIFTITIDDGTPFAHESLTACAAIHEVKKARGFANQIIETLYGDGHCEMTTADGHRIIAMPFVAETGGTR